MNFNEIITAVVALGVISIIIGLILSLAEKAFYVKENELEAAVREALPGNNCGGCGYAGCDGLAKAIANKEASVSACPVGGMPVAEKIAAIMGEKAEKTNRKVAFVKCSGTADKRHTNYNYFGTKGCDYIAQLPDPEIRSCKYGCIGCGTCAKACDFNAIKIVDSKARVDEELCVACGKCVKACPLNIIELVDANSKYRVQCSSHDKGKAVSEKCDAGCIGCRICYNNCPQNAIIFENNLAAIDYSKCVACGICEEKCPRKIIKICG